VVLQAEKEDKTVQPILPNIQDKNNREMYKGMDSLKLTVSLYRLTTFLPMLTDPSNDTFTDTIPILTNRSLVGKVGKLPMFVRARYRSINLLDLLVLIYVDPMNTSRACSRCGGIKGSTERAYPSCGLDRHLNAL